MGLDVCLALTKRVHRVRFPAVAPRPRVGLLVASHHRDGSPTLRVCASSRVYWGTLAARSGVPFIGLFPVGVVVHLGGDEPGPVGLTVQNTE